MSFITTALTHGMTNPWRLSDIKVIAIAALIEHEAPKRAASKVGVSIEAFHDRIRRTRQKMGVESTLLAAVKYDRWARREMNTCG